MTHPVICLVFGVNNFARRFDWYLTSAVHLKHFISKATSVPYQLWAYKNHIHIQSWGFAYNMYRRIHVQLTLPESNNAHLKIKQLKVRESNLLFAEAESLRAFRFLSKNFLAKNARRVNPQTREIAANISPVRSIVHLSESPSLSEEREKEAKDDL